MQGEQAIRGMLKAALKGGTGALLATSVTASFADTTQFIRSVAAVMASPDNDAAQLLGIHLEGPFISPAMLGAQPPHTAKPDLPMVESWLASGLIKVMTYAPEVDTDKQLLKLLQQYNVKAQVGHTNCTWHQAQQVLQHGGGVTHLYNAMSKVAHRDGGAATAALAYANYAEIITDGIHVERAAFDAAYRAIPNLYSVTDSTAAAGMPDGSFQLGTLQVCKQDDRVCLADGTLAGSCLTQLRSMEILREWGLDWTDIAALNSTRPASWINNKLLGKIDVGAQANWLELSGDNVVAIWVSGSRFDLTG